MHETPAFFMEIPDMVSYTKDQHFEHPYGFLSVISGMRGRRALAIGVVLMVSYLQKNDRISGINSQLPFLPAVFAS